MLLSEKEIVALTIYATLNVCQNTKIKNLPYKTINDLFAQQCPIITNI